MELRQIRGEVIKSPASCEEVGHGVLNTLQFVHRYKHNTSGLLAGCQRLVATGQPADHHPLGGTGLGCKVVRRQTATLPTPAAQGQLPA